MSDSDWLADRFEENRGHLRAVAYRMLGSVTEADDAVQEAWIRLSRSDTSEVENLGGWLTTVVSRVSLDMLRSRRSRREEPLDDRPVEVPGAAPAGVVAGTTGPADPESEALLADAVGPALLVVLDTLAPAERLAFVLHDLFGVSFDEIAPIVDRSPTAARQLASRARRRVRGADAPRADLARQRRVVDAFLAASRAGDFAALVAVLDPDVVARADATAASYGADVEVTGADAVARTFFGRARGATRAVVDGVPGLVWTVGGRTRVVFSFTIAGDRILAIDLLADAEHLVDLELSLLSE